MNNLALMAHFNKWVNGRLYACVAQLDDDAYRKDRKAFFGSIHNTLNHLLVVDRLWASRIEGVGLGDERLTAPITYRPIAGGGGEQMRADHILITLYNHQTHHRGQITCMLTQAGIDPGDLDVIDFLDDAGLS